MPAERYLARLPRANLFQDALAAIERYIDELPAGTRIHSERELAVALGVSRPLARQAVKVLEGLGRLESRPGSGTFVREPVAGAGQDFLLRGLASDAETRQHVVVARRAVEVAVVDALSELWDPSMAVELEDTIRLSGDPVGGGSDIRVNLDFEAKLAELSGNPVLQRLQSLMHSAWFEAHRDVLGERSASEPATHEHRLILDALRGGDRQTACSAMNAHIHGIAQKSDAAPREPISEDDDDDR